MIFIVFDRIFSQWSNNSGNGGPQSIIHFSLVPLSVCGISFIVGLLFFFRQLPPALSHHPGDSSKLGTRCAAPSLVLQLSPKTSKKKTEKKQKNMDF